MMYSHIVICSVNLALETFLPGERASLNWVTKVLYEFQDNDLSPLTELEQDIVWLAESLEPDRTKWNITLEQYEFSLFSEEIDSRGLHLRVRNFSKNV